ncbi:Pyridoxal 4-dehydrogenase [Catenulispora acidiphila DSM 44928]|uniref:Pyridoxal 4-dehydrogenase n=1 Tax=Catenulispora acidiphila (strain DSM 44928 / JCM 14897 / NBRC 102108 / NRRL B-24433 / ID139908) TaxID=479433 RepID=C7Q9Y6_CATAD|nr:aldo/keto reductase [Catenulispora acidiphila]ACU70384.1 Pyridoxal 4-dehydrogenase [Catenulispora acidiphila DSM 44928]
MSTDRTIGRGVELTELSYGAAGIGNLFTVVGDDEARAAVDAAWDAGIRAFDTAPHYGLGLSERRLGAALRGRPREEFVVSSKVGRILEPVADPVGFDDQGFAVPAAFRRVWDFSGDGVRRSIEASLERLGLDRIDTVLIHDPDLPSHAEQAIGEAFPALAKLRSEGVIGAIGVGMNQTAIPLRFMRDTDIDVVLLAGRYTLLDRSGAELLDEAVARGVSVVVGGVFNSGLLVDPKPSSTYDYAAVPPEILNEALRLKGICEQHGVPLRAAALQFPQRHPAVKSVLIGARSAPEVLDCVEMARLPIPDAVWAEV